MLDLPVAKLLSRWPSALQTFIAYRLACAGCDFSWHDSLQLALDAHHVAPERFLRHLQVTIEEGRRGGEPPPASPPAGGAE